MSQNIAQFETPFKSSENRKFIGYESDDLVGFNINQIYFTFKQTAQTTVDHRPQISANHYVVRSVIPQSTTEYTFIPKFLASSYLDLFSKSPFCRPVSPFFTVSAATSRRNFEIGTSNLKNSA